MSKILVVSDSHNNQKAIEQIVNMYPKCDAYLHLGDSGVYESQLYPFISVKGNNDYYINDEVKILTINNIRIYMTHGHKMYLNEEVMVNIAKKNNCKMFLFGHTHRPFYKEIDGIHLLNPGSISLSRSAVGETYAIIEIDENTNINVEIKLF